MMPGVFNAEAMAERARNLGPGNGLSRLFVTLPPAPAAHADLVVEFHNANLLPTLLADLAADLRRPWEIFPIRGGSRLPAGPDAGQVRVTAASAGPDAASLRLKVEPVGDYGTYVLDADYPGMDPVFRSLPFKFRPGCFNLNCAPGTRAEAPAPEPIIDYQARDFDSFRHLLIQAMRDRVPGWEPTSEGDLDQVILDLIAVQGDELADYQDRVMAEAYLATARRRESLARHARLVDYHVHQGNQSDTWLALRAAADGVLPAGFAAWTGAHWDDPGAVPFLTREPAPCLMALNAIRPYTWGGALDALAAGDSEADLALPPPFNPASGASADAFRDLFRAGGVPRLLLRQDLNPETGTENGRDPSARRLLRLREGAAAAESVFDPAAGVWLVRVRWRPEDRLDRRFCLLSRCAGISPPAESASFRGNLVRAFQGRPCRTVFRAPGSPLAPADLRAFEIASEEYWEKDGGRVTARLPEYGLARPLAFRDTPPGGEKPPESSLEARVAGFPDAWEENADLIESAGDAAHFQVEIDAAGMGTLRFGDGSNGLALPEDAVITCRYQRGGGAEGNVGPDRITGFDAAKFPLVEAVGNPFDVGNGREAEPAAEIRRRAPEAFRARQLRAVTLADYARRAEELPGVQAARASYGWTGSWRCVRVAIDPAGTTGLAPALRNRIAAHLEAVRLIGEDLEIRPARYVPLDLRIRVCAGPGYWPDDLRWELAAEFSDGYTGDGRPGFFHPDLWSFGQALHASRVLERALGVTGVERVLRLSLRRWDPGSGGGLSVMTLDEDRLPGSGAEALAVGPDEIIRVANDPDHLERGRITFEIVGGRR
ncbi:MAG TPA: baseplate J/gp47 family protein [Fibrobacteria bacterium]|nr:baseplate J/gp47 family protein [Fibrobacteria bacterium]